MNINVECQNCFFIKDEVVTVLEEFIKENKCINNVECYNSNGLVGFIVSKDEIYIDSFEVEEGGFSIQCNISIEDDGDILEYLNEESVCKLQYQNGKLVFCIFPKSFYDDLDESNIVQ